MIAQGQAEVFRPQIADFKIVERGDKVLFSDDLIDEAMVSLTPVACYY